jgi:hypothetical protein
MGQKNNPKTIRNIQSSAEGKKSLQTRLQYGQCGCVAILFITRVIGA